MADSRAPSTKTPEEAIANDAAYSEGSVWSVQFIRAKRGQTPSYLSCLGTQWKPLMEAAKQQGIILGYRVLMAPLNTPEDWDFMLLVELPNMAALDGYNEKMRALATSLGAEKPRCSQHSELVGMKLLREAVLK
ncbi:hypothetical protein [Streptomyces cinerochromogenes]|uniref:hypothetical protein n=1 Tax=Streptomyces cinerochromogenes TaxID=66422 RepID=UPI00166FB369|nr:hypothetical protein [Streptomyces cinerochromogenes]GGS69865.1 hypothetical protein GCM10010206_35200 [Streptomyces cinerochromogenes]